MDNNFILEKLSNPRSLYLDAEKGKCFKMEDVENELELDAIALYRVDEVTFEENAPRKEALENVITAMDIKGVNFVYIIMGDKTGVKFYYGVARDFHTEKAMEISEAGEQILKPSLQGNFRGSVITKMTGAECKKILKAVEKFEETRLLEGVPGINQDDEQFQAVDRVIDVMLGDEFALMLIAKPLSMEEINKAQNRMYDIYDRISPMGKFSMQTGEGTNEGENESETDGESKTAGDNKSDSTQQGSGTNKSETENRGGGNDRTSANVSVSIGQSTNQSKTQTVGKSYSETKNKSKSKGTQKGTSTSKAETVEHVNRKIQDWIKYMDEIVLPRLDYGLGKGLFVVSTVLLGNSPASVVKIENTLRSVYGGETGNRMPLKAFKVNEKEEKLLKRMQIPCFATNRERCLGNDEMGIRTACSQIFTDEKRFLLGSWMSSQEISLLAGLPQKEVVGLALREEVEFGLNVKNDVKKPIEMGYLVESGNVLDGENGMPKIEVNFDQDYLDKHIFVTGVTGSGKTTTCQRLLMESGENFLVIEPAKTEYRVMSEDMKDMLVFTLGNETGAPFRLNPFEFFEGENITSRVDMIKASMEAAFDMEAAIPQILEEAMYKCYEAKGWDIATNRNSKYQNPYADGVYAFPTLGDLESMIERVVKEQGFDERLRNDYIGSIKARLKGLTVGSKGLMLNTPRSIDFAQLLDKKVVLELEQIKSASEKSLIMGFILANLSEAIRFKYNKNGKKSIEHITLIEEAHRLLSKYTPGDSLNKKQGVEMFADMLAEVRKYGESLIIADQIPNKLTSEVLKNTNTKIVHKIFAQDDKDAIGNTMALKEEQKEHLSYLCSGRAIVMHPGLSKAIQVQIKKDTKNDTERAPLDDEKLRENIIKYYKTIYKKGVLPGLELIQEGVSEDVVKLYLDGLNPSSGFIREYKLILRLPKENKVSEGFLRELKDITNKFGVNMVTRLICAVAHKKDSLEMYPETIELVEKLLKKILREGVGCVVLEAERYFDIEGTVKGGN